MSYFLIAIGAKPIIDKELEINIIPIDQSQEYIKNKKEYFATEYNNDNIWQLEYFDEDWNDLVSCSENDSKMYNNFTGTRLYKVLTNLHYNNNYFYIWWATEPDNYKDVTKIYSYDSAIEVIIEKINQNKDINISYRNT